MDGSVSSSNNISESHIIGNNLTSKYIIYTADGTEFHLQEFYEGTASGKFENGDTIRFHPENIIAICKKQQ